MLNDLAASVLTGITGIIGDVQTVFVALLNIFLIITALSIYIYAMRSSNRNSSDREVIKNDRNVRSSYRDGIKKR